MTNAIQTRGNCQHCGRLQAFTKGKFAKHGYKVEARGQGGYFSGACSGHKFVPMQIDRTATDEIVAVVRAEVDAMLNEVAELEQGLRHPTIIETSKIDRVTKQPVTITWEEAPEWQRKGAIGKLATQMKCRAAAGTRWADYMENLANELHGTELVEVEK